MSYSYKFIRKITAIILLLFIINPVTLNADPGAPGGPGDNPATSNQTVGSINGIPLDDGFTEILFTGFAINGLVLLRKRLNVNLKNTRL